MRTSITTVLFGATALWAAGGIQAQIDDPIAAPIVKRGLSVEIRNVCPGFRTPASCTRRVMMRRAVGRG